MCRKSFRYYNSTLKLLRLFRLYAKCALYTYISAHRLYVASERAMCEQITRPMRDVFLRIG